VIGQIAAYAFTVTGTIVTMTSNSNPSVLTIPVTFAATVTSAAGTPSGTVAFYDGSTFLGTGMLDGSGTATLTVSNLAVGTHSITARFSGGGAFSSAGSNTVYQVVIPYTTNTALALTAGTNPSSSGASLTFTAAISSLFAGTPHGTVTFMDGNTPLGTGAVVSGSASFTTAALAVGVHAITAVYGGDANFNGSTSPVFTQVVQSGGTATTTNLTVNGSSSATINFGTAMGVPQTASFVVSVTPNTATGSVVLLEGDQQFGPVLALSGGQASYATQLSAGTHTIEAVYIGDGANAGSTSPAVVINRSPRPKPR
jgi:hypothetical protein